MSVPSTSPINEGEKRKSKSSIIWMALSFLLSATILAWAFTAPFRNQDQPLVSSMKSDRGPEQIDLSDRIEQRRTVAENIRNSARALDEEFMKTVAKSRELKSVPGIKESKKRWSQRVERVKKQVSQFKDAKKGSIEWVERQQLLESLSDAPQ